MMTVSGHTPAPVAPLPTTALQGRFATHRDQLVWVNAALAAATVLAYAAIAFNWLAIGMPYDSGIATFAWSGAAGYALGGALILLRRRWLWITGWVINALVLSLYVSLYTANPDVLWSPGGIVSKIPQILLALTLLEMIVLDWRLARAGRAARIAQAIGPRSSSA